MKLSAEFHVPVAMENDADAVALGEVAWGSGKGKARLICVTIGTGIGAGVVLDEKVYRGAAQSHPELGHHIIETSGPPCSWCAARRVSPRRQVSEIRAVCANERSYGSVRGLPGNWYPYRDQIVSRWQKFLPSETDE